MSYSANVCLNVRVIRQESEKAFNVILADGMIYWVPKSQVPDAGSYKAGDRDVPMSVSRWFAKQAGLMT